MSAPHKILVTGASGRLGSHLAQHLFEEGLDILATDIVKPTSRVDFEFVQSDLRKHEATSALLEGVQKVVHLGNHPSMGQRIPQVLLSENIAINQNLFQGAAEQGVQKIVFASTLQLIGSHIDNRTVKTQPRPIDYPINSETPADPSNTYALSKLLSEHMLRYYAERCEIDSIAIRFPYIHDNAPNQVIESDRADFSSIFEGFTSLSRDDAASLVLSILNADLPGFRIYAPATGDRCKDLSQSELLKRFYPDAPADLPDMVDIARITQETGWTLKSRSWPTASTRNP